jgi:hypothetical protein
VNISDLDTEKKRAFCSAMAICGFSELTDSAYSNAFDLIGIEEPNGFDYLGEAESSLYAEIESLSIQVMTFQILFKAIYEPENFEKLGDQNKGYAHAIHMLNQLKPKDLDKKFDSFIETILND